jgi:hypothetical protein
MAWVGRIRPGLACGGPNRVMYGFGAVMALCFLVAQVHNLSRITCSYGVCMLNLAKAMLSSEPTTVTPAGATNLPGGVVVMLISPPCVRLRRKLCFQVYLEPMMAAQPCVAPLLEGIIEKLAGCFVG